VSDEILRCVECGRTFAWSYSEQRYYREHGLSQPRRCPTCRSRRRNERQAGMRGLNPPSAQASAPRSERQWNGARGIGRVRRQPWWQRPEFSFGAVTLTAGVALAVVLWLGFALDGVLSWLIAINLVTLLAYGYDKAVAGSKQTRVPEKVLLGLTVVGGTIGAVAGVWSFRHKSSKGSFQIWLWMIAVAQIALVVVYLMLIKGRL